MGLPCRGQPGQRSDQRQAQARGHTRARSATGPHRLRSGLSRPPTLLSGHSLARGTRGLRPDPGDRGRDTLPRWPGLQGATIIEMSSNQTSDGPARNRTKRDLRGLVGRAQESGKSSRALVYTCRGPPALGRGVSGDPASLQGSPLHHHHLVPYPHSGLRTTRLGRRGPIREVSSPEALFQASIHQVSAELHTSHLGSLLGRSSRMRTSHSATGSSPFAGDPGNVL